MAIDSPFYLLKGVIGRDSFGALTILTEIIYFKLSVKKVLVKRFYYNVLSPLFLLKIQNLVIVLIVYNL